MTRKHIKHLYYNQRLSHIHTHTQRERERERERDRQTDPHAHIYRERERERERERTHTQTYTNDESLCPLEDDEQTSQKDDCFKSHNNNGALHREKLDC